MPKYSAIWIGDESRLPWSCIDSWEDIRVFGNKDVAVRKWRLAEQMRYFTALNELNGAADCMRWELLYDLGGIFVDADSIKLRELPKDFDELPCIAAWEQELERPGLIACGYLKFPPQHPFVMAIILDILGQPLDGRMAWEVVGPMAITRAFHSFKPNDLTILPSHFFTPRHLTGREYSGTLKYADQLWGSTFNGY